MILLPQVGKVPSQQIDHVIGNVIGIRLGLGFVQFCIDFSQRVGQQKQASLLQLEGVYVRLLSDNKQQIVQNYFIKQLVELNHVILVLRFSEIHQHLGEHSNSQIVKF